MAQCPPGWQTRLLVELVHDGVGNAIHVPMVVFRGARSDGPAFGIIQMDEPNSENRRWETIHTPAPGKHYYFVKVTQVDGNMLWSAPI